jgi:putative alpha-1,2-mannosidase
LFANVTLSLDTTGFTGKKKATASSGATLVVSALNQSPTNVYVQGVALNGQAVGLGASAPAGAGGGVVVSYSDLMLGGELVFTMGPAPPTKKA